MTSSQTPLGQVSDAVDAEILLTLFFLRKKLVVYCMAATFLTVFVATLVQRPQYESSVKVLAEPRKEDNPYALELRSQQERKVFLETQKELVVSQSVLMDTIEALEKRPRSGIRQRDVDALASRVSVVSRSNMGRTLFAGSGIGESNTFFVTVRDSDPEQAAAKANQLVDCYLKVASRVRGDQANSAIRTLEVAVEKSTARVKQAHEKMVTFEKDAGLLYAELINLNKDTVRVFPELQQLREEFEIEKVRLAEQRSRIDMLDSAVEAEDPALPLEILTGSPVISFLVTKHAELQIKLNEKLPFFTEKSREVTSIEEQLASATESLRGEIRRAAEGEKRKLEMMESAQAQREAALKTYEGKLATLSQLNNQYAALRQDYDGNAAALDSQIKALAEAQIAAAKEGSGATNIAIIDEAVAASDPVSPRWLFNMLVSLPLGFVLGLLAVLAGQLLRPVFVHPRQVERLSRLPVISTIPHFKSEKSA